MGDAIESVPADIIQEMCQLTKANSTEGCKASQVDIVYTPYLNLKKSERMDTGSVGFKDESFRLLLKHIEKDKDVVKRLEKTRTERKVDFVKEKEDRELEERGRRKKFNEEQKLQEKELKSYASLQELDKGKTNADASKTHSVEECKE